PAFAAGVDADLKGVSDPARPDPQGIHGDAQPLGERAPTLDSLAFGVAVVLDGQVALLRLQLVQAAVEALEPLLLCRGAFVCRRHRARSERHDVARFIYLHIALAAADVLEQDEARHDVTVPRRRRYRDRA